MEVENINKRIDALDAKLDLVLAHIHEQKMNSEMMNDLASDFQIIGKDMYDSTVKELDQRQIELNPEELTDLGISFLRNIGNIRKVIEMLEMGMDLANDISPIANEAIIDFTKKLSEFEQKGYFEFVKEIVPIVDNIVQGFKPQDVKELANSIVSILNTLKQMTQPEVLNTMNNAVKVFSSIETENVPSYSLWQTFRELNSPEMKKALGVGITFLKNISKNEQIKS